MATAVGLGKYKIEGAETDGKDGFSITVSFKVFFKLDKPIAEGETYVDEITGITSPAKLLCCNEYEGARKSIINHKAIGTIIFPREEKDEAKKNKS